MGELTGRHELLAGASFSLHPMCDNFIEVIEEALTETDTSKVWMQTDDVTTIIRGSLTHVFDVIRTICIHAAKTGKHVALQSTYSLGCSDVAQMDHHLVTEGASANLVTEADKHLYAAAKFALYPIGLDEYYETIFEQMDRMKEYVDVTRVNYATKLSGSLVAIFEGLEKVFQTTVDMGASHTVMTMTVSMNSPSHK